MNEAVHDVAVIGGGVNGCGIARDLAGRRARVLLLERGDLAQGTSSASTKLIHGGLRYLEHREFALVRESLAERERLWAIAPHIVRPTRFVLPWVRGLRPRWMLRLGLLLYDHIGGRRDLPGTRTVDLRHHPAGAALRPGFTTGFVYSDCRVEDARLVVLNARDAADRGATVLTGCEATALRRAGAVWEIDTPRGTFRARAVVNAAGPSVNAVIERAGLASTRAMRLVRGSHIVVPRLFDHGFAYFFQLPDGRIFFAIPFERDFTLIGTTDRDHAGSLEDVRASDEEVAYLCEGANRYFGHAVSPAGVVWRYAGVRPLVDDGSGRPEAATRGYRLDLSVPEEGAPLLNVFGGKITTYRRLSEEAADLLGVRLGLQGRGWTASAALPGGDFAKDGAGALLEDLKGRYPFLEDAWAERLARDYGTLAQAILGEARTLDDCGRHFGHGLTEREAGYLMRREWARTAEDVLWRRTKLGLRFSSGEAEELGRWMAAHEGEEG